MDLMTDYWDMYHPFEPNLVITVIGGAKNFKLDGKKKEIFNRGLVEVRDVQRGVRSNIHLFTHCYSLFFRYFSVVTVHVLEKRVLLFRLHSLRMRGSSLPAVTWAS